MDEDYGLHVVYLDFENAFYTVPIQLLLHTSNSHDTGGKVCKWIENFFTSRKTLVSLA